MNYLSQEGSEMSAFTSYNNMNDHSLRYRHRLFRGIALGLVLSSLLFIWLWWERTEFVDAHTVIYMLFMANIWGIGIGTFSTLFIAVRTEINRREEYYDE